MERSKLARSINKVSHLTGKPFTLRSGQTSNEYFDKYQFESNPKLLRAIAKELAPQIPNDTEILAGLEMGGIPIATALSLETGLNVVFVRKQAKDYGTEKLAEGPEVAGKKLCIVEDVVTTGGQIILSAKDLRNLNANVENVLCVIDRQLGGKDNLKKHGLNLISLFTAKDLKN
jgi:orotate phosphoribosyltransferase